MGLALVSIILAGIVALTPAFADFVPSSEETKALTPHKCQTQFIESSKAGPSMVSRIYAKTPVSSFIVSKAKAIYPALSDFDKTFLTQNPMDADSLRMIKALAYEYTDMQCSSQYKDDGSQYNAILHFALNLFAAVYMGEKKACEWSTGHELGAMNSGFSQHMDLSNNKQGLVFFSANTKLANNCADELRLRLRARERRSQKSENSTAKNKLSSEQEKLFDYYMQNNSDKKGSCDSIFKTIVTSKDYPLIYSEKASTDSDCKNEVIPAAAEIPLFPEVGQ